MVAPNKSPWTDQQGHDIFPNQLASRERRTQDWNSAPRLHTPPAAHLHQAAVSREEKDLVQPLVHPPLMQAHALQSVPVCSVHPYGTDSTDRNSTSSREFLGWPISLPLACSSSHPHRHLHCPMGCFTGFLLESTGRGDREHAGSLAGLPGHSGNAAVLSARAGLTPPHLDKQLIARDPLHGLDHQVRQRLLLLVLSHALLQNRGKGGGFFS